MGFFGDLWEGVKTGWNNLWNNTPTSSSNIGGSGGAGFGGGRSDDRQFSNSGDLAEQQSRTAEDIEARTEQKIKEQQPVTEQPTSVENIPEDPVSGSDTNTGFFDPNAFYDMYNKATEKAAQDQRNWSAEQAQKQMDYQTNMANTQYQRAKDDMLKAGLNPYMLMSGSAHSASAPTGAMATSSQQDVYKNNDQLSRDMGILEFISGIFGNAIDIAKIVKTPTKAIKK